MNQALADYTADVEKQFSDDQLLGLLVWYSFSEIHLPHGEMVLMLLNEKISGQLPFCPTDVNVFKRVVTRVKGRYKKVQVGPNSYEQFRVVSMSDTESMTRRLIVDTVDSKGKKISSQELIDIVFDRTTATIGAQRVDPAVEPNDLAKQFAQDVENEFYAWRNCLDTYNTREWVRKHIAALGATQVSPGGGTYFIPASKTEIIEKLERFAQAVNANGSYGKIVIHSLPLVDNVKQRTMVQEAFEAETIGEIDRMLTELTELNADPDATISADRYESIKEEYARLMTVTSEYQDVLDTALAHTASRLKIFQGAVINVSTRVRGDK